MSEPTWPKGPPRRLLLATDLSARCDRALDRAAALAAQWRAELVVVHALEQTEDFYAAELDRRLPSWRRTESDTAAVVEDQLRRDIAQAGIEFSIVVEQGRPADLVLRVAQERECELIVVGLARDETLGRFGLGASVDRLLRRSRIPLLVVKRRARADYGGILVATDLSDPSRAAVRTALAFFPDRKLVLFHAYEATVRNVTADPTPYEEEYREVAAARCVAFLAESGVADEGRARLELIVEPGEAALLIPDYVRHRGIDLTVIGARGQSALLDVLLGGTARQLLWTLPSDVLVVREPGSNVEENEAAA